ncbi:Uncharacterised protein [Burkholderia pseudomallei]|nr:Uncharacterised protein [Burkholderia pseudomallei]CAJ5915679.1 Uncharacterised protein [Burkholderia pseudomallei]
MTLRFRKTRELVRLSISDSASQTVSWYDLPWNFRTS